jgi:PIN domain nuclease of toxin-antitoxin system
VHLIDSHVLIWWWTEPVRLSPKIRAVLRAEGKVLVSAATAWEIATKVRLGRLKFPPALLENLEAEIREEGWTVSPVEMREARVAGSLDWEHRDPFDRVLAAQAIEQGLVLISRDPVFATLPQLKILW